MRIFVVRVIIREGTLVTDTFILRGRSLSLSMMLIWLSRRWIMRRWIGVAMRRVAMWGRRITILRLTRGTRRTKRLTMGAIQHWRRLFTISGISVLPSTFSGRTSCIRAIHSRSRDERSLGAHRMEQTLLVEADTVLASSIRRAVIARATNLKYRQYISTIISLSSRHTFLLRQYLQAMAVLCLGAGAAGGGCVVPLIRIGWRIVRRRKAICIWLHGLRWWLTHILARGWIWVGPMLRILDMQSARVIWFWDQRFLQDSDEGEAGKHYAADLAIGQGVDKEPELLDREDSALDGEARVERIRTAFASSWRSLR